MSRTVMGSFIQLNEGGTANILRSRPAGPTDSMSHILSRPEPYANPAHP